MIFDNGVVVIQQSTIKRQKCDHFGVTFIIDELIPLDNVVIKFGIFSSCGKRSVVKECTIDVLGRKAHCNFIPDDTKIFRHANNNWELEAKYDGERFYTIGSGNFILLETLIANE